MKRFSAVLLMIATSCYPNDIDNVTKVNRWVNRNIKYITDKENQGVADYWQTPRETLKSMQGDCEDYAILKYFMLINWGIPNTEVSIWYGKTPFGAHVIVRYNNMILDNRTDEITTVGLSDFQGRFELTRSIRWTEMMIRMVRPEKN
jgi:predicted transglutaminase-like cysteine proteinase